MNQLNVLKKLQTLVVGFLVFWLLLITPTWMASAAAISNTSNLESINQPDSSLQQEIEKEKQAALDEAESRLDQEAIAAIEETRKAIQDI